MCAGGWLADGTCGSLLPIMQSVSCSVCAGIVTGRTGMELVTAVIHHLHHITLHTALHCHYRAQTSVENNLQYRTADTRLSSRYCSGKDWVPLPARTSSQTAVTQISILPTETGLQCLILDTAEMVSADTAPVTLVSQYHWLLQRSIP